MSRRDGAALEVEILPSEAECFESEEGRTAIVHEARFGELVDRAIHRVRHDLGPFIRDGATARKLKLVDFFADELFDGRQDPAQAVADAFEYALTDDASKPRPEMMSASGLTPMQRTS